jgi:flagellar protein FlaI
MGTIHSGSMQELINRIESPPMNVPRRLLEGVDVVIFVGRILRGQEHIRRVVRAVEILGFETGNLLTNEVFRWNAFEDTFEYTGRCYVLDKISREFGIVLEELSAEREAKVRLIEDLQRRKVNHFAEVAQHVRAHQASRSTRK